MNQPKKQSKMVGDKCQALEQNPAWRTQEEWKTKVPKKTLLLKVELSKLAKGKLLNHPENTLAHGDKLSHEK